MIQTDSDEDDDTESEEDDGLGSTSDSNKILSCCDEEFSFDDCVDPDDDNDDLEKAI